VNQVGSKLYNKQLFDSAQRPYEVTSNLSSILVHSITNIISRGGFTPHNTLGSKDNPVFTQSSPYSPDLPPQPRAAGHFQWDRQIDSPASIQKFYVPTLSDLGDSSSLFSNTPPSFNFTGGINTKETESPIPFVFGASQEERRHLGRDNKMVNERSPAKAPLAPVVPNEQPPRMADSSFPAKPPPSSVPQFGQPTFPNSPLNRPQPQPQPKQSGMFIQPKSRPEHHRDAPCMSFPLHF